MKKGLDFQSFFRIFSYKKVKTMGKYLKQGFVRELEWQHAREEISYSKMVNLMEEECIKNFTEGIIEIIERTHSRRSSHSGEQRLDEITDYIETFNIKEK